MEVIIRKASAEDIACLTEISRQTFTETFGEENSKSDLLKYLNENLVEEKLATELANPESEFFLAEINQETVGFAKINQGNSQTENVGQNALELQRIYVLQKFLRMKIGAQLLNKVFEIALKNKATFVWLGVWEKNERAIKFYEKNGFEIFGKHDFVLGNDVQTDLMMRKFL